MQTSQNANGTFLHLLQSFLALISERPGDAELDDKDANECDEELRSLQSVQKALERRISLVSRKRNTFPQINNLPRELLVDIFTLCLDKNWVIVFSDHATLSLVCQYWNHIVDTTPLLWTRIHEGTTSEAWIVRALEKSRDAPLDITWTAWPSAPPRRDAFLNNIFRHAHRWREVSLTFEDVYQELEGFPTSSMPLLEYLSLSGGPYFRWVRPEPLDLFGGRPPPRLRKLGLGIPVPWSPTILCHLTMLSISHIQDLGPSLYQLMAILSACPDLESLSISDVSFSDEARASSSHPIHLPALATLTLRNLTTEITNVLLASIHAPNCISGELFGNILGHPLQTLFTSDVSHFFDHIRSNPGTASITCDSGIFYITRMGPWYINFNVESIMFAKDTLIWLSPLSPIQLGIHGLSTPLADVLAVVADMVALDRIGFNSEQVPVSDVLTLLATSGSAQVSTPSGWPFPGLVEMSFSSALVGDDWERLLLMLRRRKGAPESQRGAEHPKPLRKLEFGLGPWLTGVDEPVIANFSSTYWPNRLDEIRRLLGPEGELMWYRRVVTEEGVLEDYQN